MTAGLSAGPHPEPGPLLLAEQSLCRRQGAILLVPEQRAALLEVGSITCGGTGLGYNRLQRGLPHLGDRRLRTHLFAIRSCTAPGLSVTVPDSIKELWAKLRLASSDSKAHSPFSQADAGPAQPSLKEGVLGCSRHCLTLTRAI